MGNSGKWVTELGRSPPQMMNLVDLSSGSCQILVTVVDDERGD